MRVLHISDDPLPDTRVEKMAYLSRKRGWRTFFASPAFRSYALNEKVFESLHYVPWNRYVRLGFQPFFQRVKNKLRGVIKKLNPDIIHAHDVFAAKMVSDLGWPLVFDDHELVSLEKKSDVQSGGHGIIDWGAGRYEVWRWSSWEREICEKAPVITVSDDISEYYAKLGAKTFIVPNYPSLFELSKICLSKEKDKVFTAVYLGNDIISNPRPFRDLKGLIGIFKELRMRLVVIGDPTLSSNNFIISKGYIPHLRIYNMMSKYHVGLLPYRKHSFHKYANPNKPYMYAHSGMAVIVTSSLHNVVQAFEGRCRTMEDLSNLKDLLLDLSQNLNNIQEEGRKVREYALKNFIFEEYQNEVMEAYKNA